MCVPQTRGNYFIYSAIDSSPPSRLLSWAAAQDGTQWIRISWFSFANLRGRSLVNHGDNLWLQNWLIVCHFIRSFCCLLNAYQHLWPVSESRRRDCLGFATYLETSLLLLQSLSPRLLLPIGSIHKISWFSKVIAFVGGYWLGWMMDGGSNPIPIASLNIYSFSHSFLFPLSTLEAVSSFSFKAWSDDEVSCVYLQIIAH